VTRRPNSQRTHTALLLIVAIGMFGFAFALVPLYEVFCELTGLNGKTSGEAAVVEHVVPISNREVTVQFTGQAGRGLPWEFRPIDSRMRVRLGEVAIARYYARNRASQPITGQAVPSVAPGFASSNLHKIECFCFTQQELSAGEAVEMPVQFFVDEDLPEEVGTLSLSYTFYRVEPAQPSTADESERTRHHDEGHEGA
jgi:cytochrome c oxidase assembly protein subunit 11